MTEEQVRRLAEENRVMRIALEKIAAFDIPANADRVAHLVAWCSMVGEAKAALTYLGETVSPPEQIERGCE